MTELQQFFEPEASPPDPSARRDAAGMEALFRGLLEAAPDALVILGADGRMLLVNVQAESLFGYAREELIGQPIEMLLPERYRTRHAGHLALYLEAPQLRPMGAGLELYARHKEGTEFPVEISLGPVATDEGLLITSRIRDVSERERGLEALRESEERFRSAFEHSPIAKALVGLDGRFLRVNQAYCEFVGYSESELTSRTVPEVTHPEDLPAELGTLEDLLSGRSRSFQLEKRYYHKLGHTLWGQLRVSMVCDRNGCPLDFIQQIVDLTERRRAQEELARSAAMLREQAQLIELAHDAIIVRDMESRVLLWNRGAERTYGFTAGEAKGQVSHTLLQTGFPNSLEAVNASLLEHGEWDGDLMHTTQQGESIVVASRQVVQWDEDGRPQAILEINRDISAQKHAEEERARLLESERRNSEHLALASARWRLLSETAGRLLESGEPVQVVHDMFAKLAEHVGVDGYVHYCFSEAGNELLLERQFGISGAAPPPPRLALGEGVSGAVALRRTPLYVPEVQKNEESWTTLIRNQGLRAGVCYPLLAGERLLGTLGFGSRTRDHFAPGELELFATVSHYLAIAMDRQGLLESERQKSEQLTLAIREAHHRIKNNLQSIIDLLSLEVGSLEDLATAQPLRESIERISAIALVHDFLSRDKDLEHADAHRVIERLVPMVLRGSGLPPNAVKLELDIIPLSLPSKQATALALVVNELVSNAAKHAFKGRRQGRLRVCLAEDAGRAILSVQDNGPGLSPDFDLELHANVGLQVVATLAQSTLGGSLEFVRSGGLRAEVRFPIEETR